MNRSPIGVFDSGSGGLSVVQAIQTLLPQESIVYLGDHAFSPYGNKSKEFIKERAIKIIEYLLTQKAKIIVVACNTATVAGIDYYREKFPNVPIVGVVPVVKTAAERTKTKDFVVLSTEFTANSEYQKKLVHEWAQGCTVQNLGSAVLVPLIEEGKTDTNEVLGELQRLFDPLKETPYDIVVLGCTHFPFIRKAIRMVVKPTVEILDSSEAIARQVERILRQNNTLAQNDGQQKFLTTGEENIIAGVYKQLVNKEISVTHVTI